MFYLFCGDEFYPSGGVFDLLTMDENITVLKSIVTNIIKEKYKKHGNTDICFWFHIVDSNMNIEYAFTSNIISDGNRNVIYSEYKYCYVFEGFC